MKPIFDLTQTLLTGALPAAGAVIVALLILTTWKAAGRSLLLCWQAFAFLRTFFPRPSIWLAVKVSALAFLLYSFRFEVSDHLQYWEQLAAPVYAVQYSQDEITMAYEQELSRRTTPEEYRTITDSVKAWVTEFGLTPSAIYECALPECGLNPFVVRRDGKAAGFIQFTPAGLKGSGVTLDDVKQVCANRDAAQMMRLTGWYLRSRSNGRTMRTGADVYTLVFAPAFLGAPDDAVMYAGHGNPAYYLNRGLDGWVIDGRRIVRQPGRVDGAITKGELNLWLEYHKQRLLSNKNVSL